MSNGTPPDTSVTWPSAVVASFLIGTVAAITITAIVHYDSVDDALKFWSGLAGLVGVITGSLATYFFTRTSTRQAQEQAANAQQEASETKSALSVAMLHVPQENAEAVKSDPVVMKALSG
jgi:ammonia channel protein AmtB